MFCVNKCKRKFRNQVSTIHDSLFSIIRPSHGSMLGCWVASDAIQKQTSSLVRIAANSLLVQTLENHIALHCDGSFRASARTFEFGGTARVSTTVVIGADVIPELFHKHAQQFDCPNRSFR
jgi:hypothetical protein